MLKRKLLVLSVALCLLCAGCVTPISKVEQQRDIVVLYTNDVHCAVGDSETMGYAQLAAYKKQMLAENNYVTLADAGDAVQGEAIGTLSKGEYIEDIMNEVGYDVAIPGNHEFDYGMDNFLSIADKAAYTYVSCNFISLGDKKTVLQPYKIIDYDGVKVAYIGICTPKTISSSTPKYFMDDNGNYVYGFCEGDNGAELYKTVQGAVNSAKSDGARYVVALGHLGITEDCSPYTSSEIIENTYGIDAMLDGHSHSTIECEKVKNNKGTDVILTSTGTKFSSFGKLVIGKDGAISAELIKEYAARDKDTEELIASKTESFRELLNKVVAKTSVNLTIADPVTGARIIRNAETNLGDLCADAYRYVTGADVAFVNGGGIRTSIIAGDITYGQIIAVHPFGNYLCMVEATGQEILDALELSCRVTPSEYGGFLQVSGITYEIDTGIASSVKLDDKNMFVSVDGARRVKNVQIGGKALDPTKKYTVASHNYLLKFNGDGYTMFSDNNILLNEIMIDNQVLITYIRDYLGGTVGDKYSEPYGQGRITAAE